MFVIKEVLGEKGIIIIIRITRIIRAGATLVSNVFIFTWSPTIYFELQLELK